MFFSPFLALRYLKPKRTFVSIITVISILGVTLGVWLLTVVMAVFTGYGKKIEENILGFEPHLVVKSGGFIEDYVPLMDKINESDGVQWATPFVTGNVIMDYQGMRMAPFIQAIIPPNQETEPEELKRLSSKLAKRPNPEYDPRENPKAPQEIPMGKFYLDPYTTVVGKEIAKSLGLKIGSKVLLYSPKDVQSMMKALEEVDDENQENRKAAIGRAKELTTPQEVTVVGIFDSGNWDINESRIFLHLETGQVLYGFDLEECHGIGVRTDDPFQVDRYKEDLLVKTGAGVRKESHYSPMQVANNEVFRWGTTQKVVLGVFALAIGLFFIPKFGRLLFGVLAGGLVVFLGVLYLQAFVAGMQSRHFIDQSGGLPYSILTWSQINKTLFDTIAVERAAMYLILFMIMIVGAFCIMNTMITVTFQKRAEIGLMKALGAREKQIALLFLIQGVIVGVIGVIIGLITAKITLIYRNELAGFIGNVFGVRMFTEEMYKVDGGLPSALTFSDLLIIVIGSFVTSTIAALLPAMRAARLEPATALRSE